MRWCLASRDFEHLQCGGICGMTGAGCRLRMSHAMVLMTLLQNDSSSSDLGITWHLGTRNTQQISEVPQLLHKITKSDVRPEIQNCSISLKKTGFMTKNHQKVQKNIPKIIQEMAKVRTSPLQFSPPCIPATPGAPSEAWNFRPSP